MTGAGAASLVPSTNGPWFPVRLGEVSTHRKEFIQIDDTREYVRCRVQLHAKGIVLRDRIEGALIKTKDQQVCRAGEFLVAEIDAKVGGFGVVPPELDGSIVSSHYFLFAVSPDRLDHRFLDYYSKTPGFRDQVRAQGSTNYAAIRPSHVLGYTIPLPPLPEQRRIVAKLDQLSAKVKDLQELRLQQQAGCGALFQAFALTRFLAAERTFGARPLGELTTRITKGESPSWQGYQYQEGGPLFVRSENVRWGSLDIGSAAHIPVEFHRKLRRSRLVAGDVLINLVGASIGRACVVPSDVGEANVNQAVATITPLAGVLDSGFLMRYLISPAAQSEIHGGKVETARANISLGDLRQLHVPAPPLGEQRRLVAELDVWQSMTHSLRELSSSASAELDALTPAILDRAFRGEL